jgi:hypothetical protein
MSKLIKNIFTSLVFGLSISIFTNTQILAQGNYDGSYDLYSKPTTFFWAGSYMNFRFTDKLFWAGEFHLRSTQYNGVPYVGRMAQNYNRHGIKYLFSKNLSITFGGVLRLDFTPEPGDPTYKPVILEPRIWYEFLFAQTMNIIDRDVMFYHRLRFEHRWLKSNAIGAEYFFRNRYRYKFLMKIPLNTKKIIPKTIYFSPDVEIILQSGKSAPLSMVEDIRIYPHFGYIFNAKIGGSIGMMYAFGQTFENNNLDYRQRWIFRINAYISLDWRPDKDTPPVNFTD